jgi:hypothetical protein
MWITYKWENVVVNVDNGEHTKPVKKNVEYDYDVSVSEDDIVEYLTPNPKYSGLPIKDILNQECGIRKAVRMLGINEDKLEDNDDFVEFLKERYEDKAVEKFNYENEPY